MMDSEMLLADNEDGGQAVDVKFYESDIPFKTGDDAKWGGEKMVVYVANHCGLKPEACDNEMFLREMDGCILPGEGGYLQNGPL